MRCGKVGERAYLTICPNGDDVDTNEHEPEDEAQGPAWEVVCPILQDQLQSHQVRGGGNGVIEPIIPRQCETKGIIDESSTGVEISPVTDATPWAKEVPTQHMCKNCQRQE
jgi:hypothetical protein